MSRDIELSELEQIGVDVVKKGSGGLICEVEHCPTGQLYFLKVIFNNKNDEIQQDIVEEIEMLRDLDHPNIVKVYGVLYLDCEIQVVFEYMDGYTLEDAYIPDESTLSDLSCQVLSSLVYLQSRQIFHQDLKPSNILLNSRNEFKLAYFGVTKYMDVSDSYMATIDYISLEKFRNDLRNGEEYDCYAGNIWSFGLCILEFYIGRFPIEKDMSSITRCLSFIPESRSLKAPPTASPEFQDFVACCLQRDPARRWSAEQLLRHPFITLSQFSNQCSRLSLDNTTTYLDRL